MSGLGYQASGIEPNQEYGSYAKDQLGLPIEIGMVQQMELPERSFDFVTMRHVFEHLDDPFLILQRLRETLRDKGFAVIEVPNVEGTCFAPIQRFHQAHFDNFNRKTLEGIGEKCGFSVYKTVVSGDGSTITTIFQKSKYGKKISSLPGNFEKISEIIKNHTVVSHYLSIYPYLRPIRKICKYAVEKWSIKNAADGNQVLETLLAKYISE